MSPEGRARIAAVQKARWAKLHRTQQKKSAASATAAPKQPSKVAKKAANKTAVKSALAKKVAATGAEVVIS